MNEDQCKGCEKLKERSRDRQNLFAFGLYLASKIPWVKIKGNDDGSPLDEYVNKFCEQHRIQ